MQCAHEKSDSRAAHCRKCDQEQHVERHRLRRRAVRRILARPAPRCGRAPGPDLLRDRLLHPGADHHPGEHPVHVPRVPAAAVPRRVPAEGRGLPPGGPGRVRRGRPRALPRPGVLPGQRAVGAAVHRRPLAAVQHRGLPAPVPRQALLPHVPHLGLPPREGGQVHLPVHRRGGLHLARRTTEARGIFSGC